MIVSGAIVVGGVSAMWILTCGFHSGGGGCRTWPARHSSDSGDAGCHERARVDGADPLTNIFKLRICAIPLEPTPQSLCALGCALTQLGVNDLPSSPPLQVLQFPKLRVEE